MRWITVQALKLNGLRLPTSNVEVVTFMEAVAAGCLGYNEILLWLRRHTE